MEKIQSQYGSNYSTKEAVLEDIKSGKISIKYETALDVFQDYNIENPDSTHILEREFLSRISDQNSSSYLSFEEVSILFGDTDAIGIDIEASQTIKSIFQQKIQNGDRIILTQDDVDLLSKLDENSSPQSIEDLIWVRKTDYLGENGMCVTPSDGGATQDLRIVYNDKETVKKINFNRQTIHGMLNGEAENHARNNKLNGYHYIILIPVEDLPKDQVLSYRQGDTFIKGSFEVPESGIIICPENETKNVQEKYPNVTIIGYEGENPKGLGDTVVNLMGYKNEKAGNSEELWENKLDRKTIDHYCEDNGYGDMVHHLSTYKNQDQLKNQYDTIISVIDYIKENIPSEERTVDNIKQNLKYGNKDYEKTISDLFYPNKDNFDTYSKALHEVGVEISVEEMNDEYLYDSKKFSENIVSKVIEQLNNNNNNNVN